MSKFPNQLAIVAVATTALVGLSVGLSERAKHGSAAHDDEVHAAADDAAMSHEASVEEVAEAPAEEPVTEEVAEAPVEEPVTEEVAEAPAEEPVTEEVAETTAEAPAEQPASDDVAQAGDDGPGQFDGGTSVPALFVGAAWAQEAASEGVIGDLAGISFGLGRDALPEEVAAWDIDIRPDGVGLPAGSGDVWTGEEVFIEKCSVCHGDFGEAVGRWPVLAGGWDSLTHEDPVKTIGSYWPYLSTVWDYVYRAMPYGEAQSLTPDEVYAITAYLLYVNNLVDDDFELSDENFAEVDLPNEGGFYLDDRAEGEIPAFSAEPCMENCKDSVEITMRATVLDVTPDDEEATVTEAAAETPATDEAPAEEIAAEDAPADEAPVEEVAGDSGISTDPDLIAAGEGVFRQCRACHQVGEGAVNRVGPVLNGIVGSTPGTVEGFRYSGAMTEFGEAGNVWNAETLAGYLADPRGYMPGNKMSFAGLRSDEDIAAMLAYLASFE